MLSVLFLKYQTIFTHAQGQLCGRMVDKPSTAPDYGNKNPLDTSNDAISNTLKNL